MSAHKFRARSTPEINTLKAQLISSAFARAKRAIKAGFYIEAVAIEESLICDRLEAILARMSRAEVKVSTIGKLLELLKPFDVLPEDLTEDLRLWQQHRSQAIHQIVKVTNTELSDWRRRLKFSKITAVDGLQLFQRLKQIDSRIARDQKRRTNGTH